ncbi:MAG: fructosamine kinase family protein, partial [Pseudomonadota bacterium]
LRESGALRIPQVYQIDEDFLLMEYIAPGHQKADFFSRLGRGLARMHKKTSPTFGFHQDNYCGAIPQKNRPPMKDWSEFYFHNRLLFQLNLLEKKGYVLDGLPAKISALGKKLPGLLKGSEEPPSLLHGDLWGGNYLVDENGDPALMDPAVYYGHREAELGMTLLFGGFTQDFYQSYEAAYPLAPGWQKRMGLYKLYHLMNHCNLFGTSYLGQCHDVLDEYV